MRTFVKLSIECGHCGHAAELERSAAEKHLCRELTISAVSELFALLKCSRCGQRKARLFDDKGQLLIDHADLTPCENCGRPIPKPRLAALPDSLLCTSCADEKSTPARPPPYPQPPQKSKSCPRCGSPTIVRERKEDLVFFIGCSSYPNCSWRSAMPKAADSGSFDRRF